jgi:uncharacterized membrane protein YfcA
MDIVQLFGFLIGLIAGVIGSMVGIGGGVIVTPFLTYFGYIPSQIASTSLIGVLSTSLSSSIVYYQKKLISSHLGIFLCMSAIPGTFLGVYISSLFSLSDFRIYFALILIGTSIYLVLKSNYFSKNISKNYNLSFKELFRNRIRIVSLILLSFFAGVLSSCFGIGGGIIFVPLLLILFRVNMSVAAATSQFALFSTSLSGLVLFIYYGLPDYYMGITISLGSIIGGFIGSKISISLNSYILQKIFSIVLIFVSLKLFYDAF